MIRRLSIGKINKISYYGNVDRKPQEDFKKYLLIMIQINELIIYRYISTEVIS